MTAKDTIKYLEQNSGAPFPGGVDVRHFEPEDVLADRRLSGDEKRAVLADWASDARAVEHMPGYRQLDHGGLVWLDDIRSALLKLDEVDRAADRITAHAKARWQPARQRLRDLLRMASRNRRNDDDDDDDPPPTPAVAAGPRGGGGSLPSSSASALPDALQAA